MAERRLLHPFTFCIFLLVVMTSVDLLNLSAGPLARCGLGLEVRPCPGRTRRPGEFRTRVLIRFKMFEEGFRILIPPFNALHLFTMLYHALPTRWFLEVFRVVVDAARWNMVG